MLYWQSLIPDSKDISSFHQAAVIPKEVLRDSFEHHLHCNFLYNFLYVSFRKSNLHRPPAIHETRQQSAFAIQLPPPSIAPKRRKQAVSTRSATLPAKNIYAFQNFESHCFLASSLLRVMMRRNRGSHIKSSTARELKSSLLKNMWVRRSLVSYSCLIADWLAQISPTCQMT